MCDQNRKTAGGVMTVTPTISESYSSLRPELECLLKEIECVIRRNLNERYLNHVLTCLIAYEKII